MDDEELQIWFEENKRKLEDSYTAHSEPWKQSGFSGPEERWNACRIPIAECIDSSGSFLDIGCANGYLLECLLKWLSERDIDIIPYGIDLSEKLIELAKARIPAYSGNLIVANAFYWKPVDKFDYVRTELLYVPEELRSEYLNKLLRDFVKINGKLLVCRYNSAKDEKPNDKWESDFLSTGFGISESKSGFFGGTELTRVSIILK